ncbi:MAG: hypothetical protein M1834_005693 [Cirrosporium novae-zelandiae]|nr:MAG: hypothetical protein M1834_005693 [Cirrosporium novae-zelandiae]
MSSTQQESDGHKKRVIIVGAGWSGLAAAKTYVSKALGCIRINHGKSSYLQICPTVDLKIFDEDSSVGGVWSASRAYPNLIADSPVGLYEFSDLTMADEEHPQYGRISGLGVHNYLERFAVKFGLLSRIRFNTKVTNISRQGKEWKIATKDFEGEKMLQCDKLIIATGLSSNPNVPDVPNNGYKGVIMHSKSLGVKYSQLTNDSVKEVVVVGGCKSAIETTILCLSAGKKVHWVVRENEKGHGVGPIVVVKRNAGKAALINNLRLSSLLFPSIYRTDGFAYRFFCKSSLGMRIMNYLETKSSQFISSTVGYEKSENGQKIRPEILGNSFFWKTSSVSVVTSDSEFLDVLHDPEKKRLVVHRASITRLTGSGVHLSTGEIISAEGIVYATGWRPNTPMFSKEMLPELGLPTLLSDEPPELSKHWASLDKQAGSYIEKMFPKLASPPSRRIFPPTRTHFRLYRGIVPCSLVAQSDLSLTFLGLIATTQTAQLAELSALWAVTWMEGLMKVPSKEESEKQIAEFNAWMERRYLSNVRAKPLITTEMQTHFDRLVEDLGLPVARKRKGIFGWFKEYFVPYRSEDYRGIVDELLEDRKGIKVE